MKILVVCQHYFPENFQITPICEQLVADGYEVTVLTGLPNYPVGDVLPEYRHAHRDEWINGVHVIRAYEIGRKKDIFHLALNYVSFSFCGMIKAFFLKEKFDLVFAYQLSPILMVLPGLLYAKEFSLPLLIYCLDLWPESLKVYVKSEGSLFFKIIKAVSTWIYGSANLIVSQSKPFLQYHHETHGIEYNKQRYLPAFADETYLEQDFRPKDGDVNFVFLGNVGKAQNLELVIEAICQIRDIPGFAFHIVGDGSNLESVKHLVQIYKLENLVKFYGRRSVEEMPFFYKMANACIVSLKNDTKIGLTLPAKLQGYMAAGKPIIGMIDGAAREVIEEARCGLCVSATDVDGMARALEDFIIHQDKYAECGENARKYFKEHFRKEIFMNELEKIFTEATK